MHTKDYVNVIVRYKNFQFVLFKPYETAFIEIFDDICVALLELIKLS